MKRRENAVLGANQPFPCEYPRHSPVSGWLLLALLLASVFSSFASGHEATSDIPLQRGEALRSCQIPDGLQKRILTLNPDAVSESDVRDILDHAPAPQIFLIHGGIPPSDSIMDSFGEFLVKMGYPALSIENPRSQSFSYSPYSSSSEIAGYAAWYYEHTAMRPMIIGHSQGGMQTIRILEELDGRFSRHLVVWNPHTGKPGTREQITDPLLGNPRSVVGLRLSYASALAAGGLARINPSHLVMLGRLRTIPDTVEDFTGYHMAFDLLGGDLLGFGHSNDYKSGGSATVRNVTLPMGTEHFTAPVVNKYAEKPATRDWIDHYQPGVPLNAQKPVPPGSPNIVYAADIWYRVKKHWVLELQRMIKARNALVRD